MIKKLFVYGTLQLPEITQRVVGCEFETLPAVLSGYRCGLVQRADFPGIVPCAESVVKGALLHDLSPQQIACLDRYEGELYQRIQVHVKVDAEFELAWVYSIVPWARGRVSKIPWSIGWYRTQSRKPRLTYR